MLPGARIDGPEARPSATILNRLATGISATPRHLAYGGILNQGTVSVFLLYAHPSQLTNILRRCATSPAFLTQRQTEDKAARLRAQSDNQSLCRLLCSAAVDLRYFTKPEIGRLQNCTGYTVRR